MVFRFELFGRLKTIKFNNQCLIISIGYEAGVIYNVVIMYNGFWQQKPTSVGVIKQIRLNLYASTRLKSTK